jgi:hypothetical protein
MREIDPQSGVQSSDERLGKALRGLAATSRQGASVEVADELATAFRRHHARRRRVRSLGVAAGLLVVIGLASLRSMRPVPTKQAVGQQPAPAQTRPAEAVTVAKAMPPAQKPAVRHIRPKAANTNNTASQRQFLALPGYDPAVPADELHVVRVQLPASALWQMGAPVSPDSGARKFMADFVVSQDGTPYAVRLVQ